jgi:predicted TIM-barrel fold metal-dependent hydrolase
MNIIALEEHFQTAALNEAVKKLNPGQREAFDLTFSHSLASQLADLGAGRVKHMDATGIDIQVLSYAAPGAQVLPASEAVPLAKDANDTSLQRPFKHSPIALPGLPHYRRQTRRQRRPSSSALFANLASKVR